MINETINSMVRNDLRVILDNNFNKEPVADKMYRAYEYILNRYLYTMLDPVRFSAKVKESYHEVKGSYSFNSNSEIDEFIPSIYSVAEWIDDENIIMLREYLKNEDRDDIESIVATYIKEVSPFMHNWVEVVFDGEKIPYMKVETMLSKFIESVNIDKYQQILLPNLYK